MNQKAKILIVDDSVGLARTTALILERKGYTVATAGDGPEAIEEVKRQAFDVVFMDIKMPVMDGVEAFREIKEIKPDAVVIMMTAYTLEDLVQQALEGGAYGVLYKPIDIDEMIALIEEVKAAERGAMIMVVDGEPSICTTLKNILSRRSYQVSIAHTGEQAIAAAKETRHDVVIVDMKLPALNGLETYLAIREVNPEIVAIVITGCYEEVSDLVEQALKANAYTCLQKPIDVEMLLKLVDEIWKRKKGLG